MDSRLWMIDGKRLEPLRRPDLPALARCIVGFARGLCSVQSGVLNEVSYIQFKGPGFESIVRGDDWSLIIPKILDGSLEPVGFITNREAFSAATVEVFDAPFFNRVLGVLNGLFTEDFPTSKL